MAGFATVDATGGAPSAAVSAADLAQPNTAAGLPAEDGDVEREVGG